MKLSVWGTVESSEMLKGSAPKLLMYGVCSDEIPPMFCDKSVVQDATPSKKCGTPVDWQVSETQSSKQAYAGL